MNPLISFGLLLLAAILVVIVLSELATFAVNAAIIALPAMLILWLIAFALSRMIRSLFS